MTSFFARLVAVTTCSVVALAPINAQERKIELGIDAGLSVFSIEGESVTAVNVPIPALRVGFFVSDRLSFEPTLALNYGKIDDLSTLGFGLNFGVLYHLTTERDRPQLFLRPLVGYAGSRFSGTPNGIADSNNGAALVGIGIGAKVPQGDRFALRFGADYERRLEDDPAPALNRYIATVGISFFTR